MFRAAARSARLFRAAAPSTAPVRRLSSASVGDRVFRYVKSVSIVKTGLAVCGGLGSLVVADPVYVLWKASACDLPDFNVLSYEIPRDREVSQLTEVMDSNAKSFVVLSGTPGVGKTTAVLNAAKMRKSGVLYLNGATLGNVDKVLDKIVVKYGLPIPSFWDFVRRKRDPGWKTLTRAADWYYWWYKKELVVIIDHIDRITGAEQLLQYAKEAADEGKLRFFFIASEGIADLRKTSAYRTRAMELRLGPVSAKSVKELIAASVSFKPMEAGEVDEIIYLSGCNLSDVWYYIDGLRVGYNMQQLQRLKDYNISFSSWGGDKFEEEERHFWKRLLEAGPIGIEMPDSPAKLAALGSNHCCRIEADRVYFRDGVCVDFYARLLKFKFPVRKYEAYACNGLTSSTRV